ncbi:MAG: hypothetical protein QNJ15_14120 [Erythrobacter sp.]|nr:hypothetical protein [Erythrobacter sp.]
MADELAVAAEKLAAGEQRESSFHFARAADAFIHFVVELQARKWSFALVMSALAVLAGSLSTLILSQQNAILKQHSELLASQRNLSLAQEAQRYLPLYPELLDVIKEIRRESDEFVPFEGDKGHFSRPLKQLSPELSERIIALSHTFRPYWQFNSDQGLETQHEGELFDPGDSLEMVRLSPERGMLLRAILDNRMYLDEPSRADFSYADMRRTNVVGTTNTGEFLNRSGLVGGNCSYLKDSIFLDPTFSAKGAENYGQDEIQEGLEFLAGNEELIREVNPAILLLNLEEYRIEHADFSGSFISAVILPETRGTLKFNAARLVNVRMIGNQINISGAIADAVGVDSTSRGPVTLTAKGTLFLDRLCLGNDEPEAIEYVDGAHWRKINNISNVLERTRTIYDFGNSDFSGALFPQSLVEDGHFGDLGVNDRAAFGYRFQSLAGCYVPSKTGEYPDGFLADGVKGDRCRHSSEMDENAPGEPR